MAPILPELSNGHQLAPSSLLRPPQQRRDSSDLIEQPSILLLEPLILSPEPCNFTLKAFDLFQMADLGRQKRDLSADCFETAMHRIEVLFADPRPPVASGVEHSQGDRDEQDSHRDA